MSIRAPIAALLLSLGLFPAPSLPADSGGEVTIPRYFYTGTLDGRLPIQMELSQSSDIAPWQGSYFYVNPKAMGERILLDGSMDNQGQFQLSEFVEKDEEKSITGAFGGTANRDRSELRGTWRSADGTRSMPFELRLTARYRQHTATKDIRIEKQEDYPCSCPDPIKDEKGSCLCRATATATYPIFIGPESGAVRTILEQQGLLTLKLTGDEEDQGEFESDIGIAFHSAGLISLEVNSYSFAWGAAHGLPGIAGLNLAANPGTGLREVKLKDLVSTKKACLDRINASILEALRQQQAPAATEPQEWNLDLSRLHSRDFSLHPGGLSFIFNPYEAGPYAIGILRAPVPYSAIADCIPPSSPLAVFMKGN